MSAKERREQERARVRAALIDAGRAMFISQPYDEVSLRAVARTAGYSAPTILNHFGSKEGLIFAICEQDFGALRARFERIAKVADPVDRLRRLGEAYVDFAMENPHHYRFMFMSNHPAPDPAQFPIDRSNPDLDAYAFLRATVAEAIATGRFRPECKDADLVAQVIWSGGHGLVALHLTKGDDPALTFRPIKAAARLLIDATLRGLLKAED